MTASTRPRASTASAGSAAGALAVIGAAPAKDAAGRGFGAALATAGGKGSNAAAGERLDTPVGRAKPIKIDPATLPVAAAAGSVEGEAVKATLVDASGLVKTLDIAAGEAPTEESSEAPASGEDGTLPEGIAALLASLLPAQSAPPSNAAAEAAAMDSLESSPDLPADAAAMRSLLTGGKPVAAHTTPDATGEAAAASPADFDAPVTGPPLDTKPAPAAAASAQAAALQATAAQITSGSQGTQDMLRQLSLQAGLAAADAESLRNPPTLEASVLGSSAALSATSAQQAALTSQAQAASGEQALRSAVATPRWADELGARMVMMATRGPQEGSLTLTPEHLGPLEVRINVHQNTANVWFGAQHADTRAALTDAMPRLREMFAEAGLSLGQAEVSQQAPRQGSSASTARGFGSEAESEEPAVAETRAPARSLTSGLLDLYA